MSDQVRIRVYIDGELAAEDDLVSVTPREVATAHTSLVAEALAAQQPWLIEIEDPETGHGLRFGTEVEAITQPSVALIEAPERAE